MGKARNGGEGHRRRVGAGEWERGSGMPGGKKERKKGKCEGDNIRRVRKQRRTDPSTPGGEIG